MISEVIVCEGRDDSAAIKRSVDADTIQTHGYGIGQETWRLLKNAYAKRGLIIFTDPDHAGGEIRKRLKKEFPEAKHAYLDRSRAMDGDDIGIENASPEDIRKALERAEACVTDASELFTMEDMRNFGLVGDADSSVVRARVGGMLGIGGGNSKAFLKKLNSFGITKDELEQCVNKATSE